MVSPSKPSAVLPSGLTTLLVPYLLTDIIVCPPVPAPLTETVKGISVSSPLSRLSVTVIDGIAATTNGAAPLKADSLPLSLVTLTVTEWLVFVAHLASILTDVAAPFTNT